MKLYYTVTDGGDGSYGVQFFDDPSLIEKLVEALPEHYPAESDGEIEILGASVQFPGMNILDEMDVGQILEYWKF